jgi:hypothetical protein
MMHQLIEDEAEYGNSRIDTISSQRDDKYFSSSDSEQLFLGGVSTSELTKYFGLCDNDLEAYLPAKRDVLVQSKVEVHYLGYYLKWHPQGCYYYAVEHGDFESSPERTPSTYSKYNSIDDRIDECHYWTSLIKFGLGRATNDAAQEIRSGEITREEGVALIKRFEEEYPERFSEEILRYLSIPEKEFPLASKMFEKPMMDRSYLFRLADQFRSPHLWKYVEGEWQLRHAVWRE